MPTGTRRLLLAGGLLVVLASCAADGPDAPLPSDTAVGTTSVGDESATQLIDTSRPASADVRVAGEPSAAGTVTPDIPTTGATSSAGADGPTSTTAGSSAPTGPCAPVVALADATALADGIDLTLPWPQLQTTIAESSDAAAQSYLAVVPVAPDEIDDDLRVLADYNTALGGLARSADSVPAFQAAVDPPDPALLAATTAVDDYMRATCSIGLTGD